MTSPHPRLLGQIAVHEGHLTPGQLEEGLRAQAASEAPRRLGSILIEKGFLTPETLETLMVIQRLRVETIASDPDRGGLFGQIALRLGYVSPLQLEECLREQRQLSRGGAPVLLGQIFLRKNFISTEQFLDVLRRQKREVVQCPGCETTYDTQKQPEGAKFVCTRCGTVVQIPWRQTQARTPGTPRTPGLLGPAAPVPDAIGRYQILEQIGQGGMGVVYKALHRDLNRVFALKVLKAGEMTSADAIKRFQARLAAKLNHPNIVAVHDAGEESSIHFIAMEYIEGEPLSARLIARRERTRDALVLMEKVVRALAYAHREGVIHRDLKPANIMIDPAGEPHVMDFGLAKQAFEGSLLTRSGAFLGTPFYMAPEQIRGEPVDARSDLYTLGVILYESLTGRLPHTGQNDAETFNRIAHHDPLPPRELNSKIHPDLQTVCLKALEKDPAQRYPTADAFAEDLRRHLDGEPIQARPLGPIARFARRVRKNPALSAAAVATFFLALSAALFVFLAARSSRSFQAHMTDARASREKGDYEIVKSAVEQALVLRPGDREAKRLLEEAVRKIREQKEVEEAAERTRLQREEARPRIHEGRERILRLVPRIATESLPPAAIAAATVAAEKVLEEALAVAPRHEEALYWMARARALRGDPEGALRHLDDACRVRDYREAYFERGRLWLRKYRRPRGLPELLAREDRPLFADPAPDSPRAEAFRQMARADLDFVRRGAAERWMILFADAALDFLDTRFAEAERKADRYLETYGSEPDALALRALSHLYQRRPGKALPDLDLALRYLPMDGYLRDWRAVVLALLGRTDEALADLKRDGADAGTLCLRGSIRHVRGENEEALADFSEAVERDPRWADAFAGRAAVQSALRRSGEAEEDFTRAIELESREAAFHEGRGMARRRAGRLREAAEDLARAVELSPSRLAGLQPLIDEGRK